MGSADARQANVSQIARTTVRIPTVVASGNGFYRVLFPKGTGTASVATTSEFPASDPAKPTVEPLLPRMPLPAHLRDRERK